MNEISAISPVGSGQQLSPDQQAEVEKLEKRDRDVRAHEEAHVAAAGALANGIEYTYEAGPDGKLYAVAGKVKIMIPPGLSPEQMLAAARELRSAAEAPTDPSTQDLSVAAQAEQMESKAEEAIRKDQAQPAQTFTGGMPQTPFRGFDRKA